MLDYVDYTIGDDGYQGNGNGYHGNGHNGYDQLNGDWGLYYKVAKRFNYKVKREDSEDFLHDLFLAFANVKEMRVAQYQLADYWRKHFKRINGIDCSRCSQEQREKCKDWYLYPDCPKAIKLESLDRLVEDGNGDSTPFYELIADDKAVDLVAMVNARHILKGYPHKAVKLAYKRYAGYRLEESEQRYLRRFQKRVQKTLF